MVSQNDLAETGVTRAMAERIAVARRIGKSSW